MTPSILLKFRTKVAIGPHIILLKGFCDAFHRLVVRGDQMSGQLRVFRQIFEKIDDNFDFDQILNKGSKWPCYHPLEGFCVASHRLDATGD